MAGADQRYTGRTGSVKGISRKDQQMDIRKMAGKLRGYNFLVFLELIELPCVKVSGIETIRDTETVSEGGVNDRVYTMKGNAKTEKTLILERGASLDAVADYLLQPGYRFTTDIIVFVLDAGKLPRYTYTFSGCYVKKVSYSDLDAMRSEFVIQRMEIAYESMMHVAMF